MTLQNHKQVRCLDYALANGADITLNSYGGLYADSAALKTAIGVAEGRGQLFVTAAGNDYGAGLHKSGSARACKCTVCSMQQLPLAQVLACVAVPETSNRSLTWLSNHNCSACEAWRTICRTWTVSGTGTNIDATPTYPASYNNSNILSVIATNQANRLANYSNYGRHNADIAAPGSQILSTILHGQARTAMDCVRSVR